MDLTKPHSPGHCAQRKGRNGRRSRLVVAASAILLFPTFCHADNSPTHPIAIAVADFDYTDTSGETRDQRAEHQGRLKSFAATLRDDLSTTGNYRLVKLNCEPGDCSVSEAGPAKLIEHARQAGANILVFGGIHKESTLIQWVKVIAENVDTGHVVWERTVSFRGDNDEAWRRAEIFIAQDLIQQPLSR